MTDAPLSGEELEQALARLEWFALTGDLKQWSGPQGVDPTPEMRSDVSRALRSLAALTAQRDEARTLAEDYRAEAYDCRPPYPPLPWESSASPSSEGEK